MDILLDLLSADNLEKAGLWLTWSLAAFGALQTGLLFLAPKTKTKWDDKALAFLQKWLPGLKEFQKKLDSKKKKK